MYTYMCDVSYVCICRCGEGLCGVPPDIDQAAIKEIAVNLGYDHHWMDPDRYLDKREMLKLQKTPSFPAGVRDEASAYRFTNVCIHGYYTHVS